MLALVADRCGKRIDGLSRFTGELREHLGHWFKRSIAANHAETELMRCAIERRQRSERRIVVGPAPPERAERAARVKAIDCAARILCQLVFVEAGEAVDAIETGRALGIAQLSEKHAFSAERLLQLIEEGHHVGVEPVAREGTVD